MGRNDDSIIGFIILGLVMMAFGWFTAWAIGGQDNVDVDVLGRYMCEKENATLKSADIETFNDEVKSLKIVCSRNTEKPIRDSYLYMD